MLFFLATSWKFFWRSFAANWRKIKHGKKYGLFHEISAILCPLNIPITLQWLDQFKNGFFSTQCHDLSFLVVYHLHWLRRCLRQKVRNIRFRQLCFIYIDCDQLVETPGISVIHGNCRKAHQNKILIFGEPPPRVGVSENYGFSRL